MSTLAILIPARLPAGAAAEFDYVLSGDGRHVAAAGRALPAALPRADTAVGVLADGAVAWHRVALPKAPAARLRDALAGVLEEQLLADPEDLHFALPARSEPGGGTWVAVTDRQPLAAALAALDAAGVQVERVVPASEPVPEGTAARGHFFQPAGAAEDELALALAHADGAATLRVAGTLARALLPAAAEYSASPAAAAAAEHWLGAPVAVRKDAERVLGALASPWNLRQFELAPQHRGVQALQLAFSRLARPEWKGARRAALALVVVQLVGLNLAAWHERRAIDARRAEMAALLTSTHPGVRAVVDAPRQMARENERLRAAAGRADAGDLETLLGAAAAAWPEGQGPVQTLRFEDQRLELAAPGWDEAQAAAFRERLAGTGLTAELSEGRIALRRAGPAAGPVPPPAAPARKESA